MGSALRTCWRVPRPAESITDVVTEELDVQAQTHTPAAIFGSRIRYVVPLFQRPYVWDQKEQWAPLWDDVRALAEKVLETPSGYGAAPVSPHFLGAIVVDQQKNLSGFIQVRHVIDGSSG
jgi:uncharacterized protein with ParB-like and HNH nuclease domain